MTIADVWKKIAFGYSYPIREVNYAIDGDTVKAVLDRGEGEFMKRSLRIAGVDCPPRTTEAGRLVTRVTSAWLLARTNAGIALVFHSTSKPKYAGRLVGDIADADGRFLFPFLVKEFGKEYKGGAKEPWQQEELDAIAQAALRFLDVN